VLGRGGKNVPADQAASLVAGYAVGLDLTLRDLQAEAKRKGLPWTVAKGFDSSAPVSEFVPAEEIRDPYGLHLTLHVNGGLRQRGSTADMLYRLDAVLAYLSRFFTMEEGDLIFTGTPEGVGPVRGGDVLLAEIQGVVSLRVEAE
jgi:2-keto-4-pentenoate hydratase/2-oxohepta-3-ene-1,7-dioic acid hydratase in catechol pathway